MGGNLTKLNQLNRANRLIYIFILILFSLLLAGCSQKEQTIHKIPAKNDKPTIPVANPGEEWKLPISVPNGAGEFYKLAGWLSESTVVYITNLEQSSSVFRYNLLSGTSELVYKTENPIVNVQMSPSKKYLLIHSSPSSYEGLVTIIDVKGNEKFKKSFPSYELVYEWNPYNETEVLVSKFDEDWSFELYLLNLKNDQTIKVSMPQPFVKWKNDDEITFLNWDENNPSLVAPLVVRQLGTGMEKTLVPAAIQFATFRQLLMTVTVNEQDQSKAIYSFYNGEMKRLFTFAIPQLTRFSDWLVPYYDYNEEQEQFITFRPVSSGEADSYTDGFQLISYNLQNGESELILKGMENAPITFSPSGKAVLFGNRYEKIIDVKTKKIYDLVEE